MVASNDRKERSFSLKREEKSKKEGKWKIGKRRKGDTNREKESEEEVTEEKK